MTHRRRRLLATACVVGLVVIAAVVVDEVLHPALRAPSMGTAVVIAGQRTNILPDPDFLTACSPTHYDDSSSCVSTTVAAIDSARGIEGLPALQLPGSWSAMAPAEQLFVAADLERTARGLAPLAGLSPALDAVAQSAAEGGTDPQLAAGGSFTTVAGNWIQGYANPLEAMYEWVYDDGVGSSNSECSRQDLSRCWEHRANILLSLACSQSAAGSGFATDDSGGQHLSFAIVIVESETAVPLSLTWAGLAGNGA